MTERNIPADKRPKAVHDETQCRLTWIIAKSGECVVGFAGGSYMAFSSAAGAAWTLRQWADGIEKDGENPSAHVAAGVAGHD